MSSSEGTQPVEEVRMSRSPIIRAFFDEPTNTVSYLVADPATRKAAAIDPVLDYDHNSGTVDTRSVEAMLKAAGEAGFVIEWALETHAHADHLSGAPYIKAKTGARIGIGEHIKDVQRIFRPIFNAADLAADGSDFDHLFKDGERFKIGELDAEVLYTPGHTPADIAYMIEDAVFVGDTLFMPDYGTARADFPGGDAGQLYRSIKRLLALPGATRLFMCHDYKAPGRGEYAWETTVQQQRDNNVHVRNGVTEQEFVAMRMKRDATLAAPRLLLPSIQVNIRAGKFPPKEDNGVTYLRIPVKLKGGTERKASASMRN
jgi:glyoxylase-like metal-dependent hydrolase (beta-lactamase superfamily II)